MNRKHMWDLRELFLGIEKGALASARVLIVIGILACIGLAIERDLFSVIAVACTISAIVSVLIGVVAWAAGDRL